MQQKNTYGNQKTTAIRYLCGNRIGRDSFRDTETQGQKGVVAQMSTLYENVGVTFTVTFNEEMELIGFYFR